MAYLWHLYIWLCLIVFRWSPCSFEDTSYNFPFKLKFEPYIHTPQLTLLFVCLFCPSGTFYRKCKKKNEIAKSDNFNDFYYFY